MQPGLASHTCSTSVPLGVTPFGLLEVGAHGTTQYSKLRSSASGQAQPTVRDDISLDFGSSLADRVANRVEVERAPVHLR